MASVIGLATAAVRFSFPVRRVLCAGPRFAALFAGPALRDEAACVETLFFERASFFAAARPLPLPPPCDLDALVLVLVLLRDAEASDPRFLEVLAFFAAAVRPRAFATPRALEALFFGDLAIHHSFK